MNSSLAFTQTIPPIASKINKAITEKPSILLRALDRKNRAPKDKPAKKAESWTKWVNRNIIERIDASGYRYFSYHIRSIEGDATAFGFQTDSGFGNRNFTDTGQISLNGRNVLGAINFNATIQDSRFRDPQSNRLSLDYRKGNWEANWGDINGSLLNTNRITTFGRQLQGIQLAYKSGNLRTKAFQSKARGLAQSISIAGNNSAGPYYLQTSQIINESERVTVDGVPVRRGYDYTISYEVGSITFINRSISPSSNIAVSFEALSVNSSQGVISGAGMSYEMGQKGRLGLSILNQKSPGASGSLSTRTDRFLTSGNVTDPYYINFEPLDTRPVIVRVNGVEQVSGVDYQFDVTFPTRFFLLRSTPRDQEIVVTYTPKPRQALDGDRQVIGVDYQLPLGKNSRNGVALLSVAKGGLKNEFSNLSGIAKQLDVQTIYGKWRANFNAKDISPDFVSVESVGFNRNEKSHTIRLENQRSENELATIRWQNSRVSSRRVNPTTGAISYTTSRVTDQGLTYDLGATKRGQLPIQFGWTKRRTTSGTNLSGSDNFSLTTRGEIKKGSWRLGLEKVYGYGKSGTVPRNPFSTFGLVSGLTYIPSPRWAFDSSASLNGIDSQGKNGIGSRIEAGLSYRSSKLSSTIRYSLNDSGGISNIGGFDSGYGTGLNGSGFSTGTNTDTETGASLYRQVNLNTSYQFSSKTFLSWDTYFRRTSGLLSSDSESTGNSFSIYTDLGNHRLFARTDFSTSKYFGTPTSTKNITYSLTLDGELSRKLSYALRLSLLDSGGTSTFTQNGNTYEGNMIYRLGKRDSLIGEVLFSRTTGQFGQRDLSSSLTYAYEIFKGVSFNSSYRFREVRNLDETIISGAYRYKGLQFQLSTAFGR